MIYFPVNLKCFLVPVTVRLTTLTITIVIYLRQSTGKWSSKELSKASFQMYTLISKVAVAAKEATEKDPDVKQLEQQLAENIGAKVEINYNKKGKGKLVISYTNLDELDGILNRINQDYSQH